jgi:hypothetical protein
VNTTLFTYGGSPNNTDWSSHVDTAYTPVFFNANLTIMFPDPAKRSTAIKTCNSGAASDSDPEKRRECYFDFKVTENAALASATSATKTALAATQSALGKFFFLHYEPSLASIMKQMRVHYKFSQSEVHSVV